MDALLDAIHDRWFDRGRVSLDNSRGEVLLSIGDTKRGPFVRRLVFSGVTKLDVEDQAHIGLYDINEVSVDVTMRPIVLTSGFPLRLVMHVSADWDITYEDNSGR